MSDDFLVLSRPWGSGSVIKFAVSSAVDKALPLVPVEHQDTACLIARHPHQHPVAPGPPLAERKGDLNRAVVITGPLPGQRGRVDAQFLRCRLDDILPGELDDLRTSPGR